MLLKEVLQFYEPLKLLCTKRLRNFKTARALSRVFKKVEEESTFYSKEYKKLLDTYAKKDEKGNFIQHGSSSLELRDASLKPQFETELSDLLETSVESFEKITINESDFVDKNDFPTAQDMISLEGIIDWDDYQN